MSKNKIITVKFGTNILATEHGKLDLNNLRSFVTQISTLLKKGSYKFVIVSSGAVTCGAEVLGLTPKEIPEKQAAAAIGQILLMKEYAQFFSQQGLNVAQILLTKDGLDLPKRKENIKNTISELLKQNIVPIINENDSVSTDELRFGDNDELSCKVALLLKSKKLILVTDTDGLFTKNPKHNIDATLIQEIDKVTPKHLNLIEDYHSPRNRGGMTSKLLAAKEASENGIDVHIVNGRLNNVLCSLMDGAKIGTFIKHQTS